MSENFSFFCKSTANCQSCLWSKIPKFLLSCLSVVLWPSLTKGMRTGFRFHVFAVFPCFSTTSANSRRTWLCLQVYLPCARAIGHAVLMGCRVPLLPHTEQSGVSDRFYLFRFAGVGSTSWTDLGRN